MIKNNKQQLPGMGNVPVLGNLFKGTEKGIITTKDGIVINADSFEYNKIKNIMTDYPGFIFNLGHGISKDTDPSKVSYMVDIIRDIS